MRQHSGQEYMRLLRQWDDPVHAEPPLDSEYIEVTRRFLTFADELSQVVRLPSATESGPFVQDATFHSSIRFEIPPSPRHDLADAYFSIRVSHWGNLAAVVNEHLVDSEILHKIVAAMEAHGFIYIPSDILYTPYDGKNRVFDGLEWWDRYFDWY